MLQSDQLASLDQLLGFAAEALDVPRHLQEQIVAAYTELGRWVLDQDEHDGRREPEVYPQGSVAQGTATLPVSEREEIDVDLVYQRLIARQSTTQEQLKQEAGERLVAFLEHLRLAGRPLPRLVEKDRCWTLVFPTFRVDVLPAIPENLDDPGTRLLISDRERRLWIVTDPKGFCSWFFSRMEAQLLEARSAIAKATGRALEQVPVWEVKTPLQRTVQVIRRHRDIHFMARPSSKPASILVTTVVGLAYDGEPTLAEAFRAVTSRMRDPRFLRRRGGALWVPNPVNEDENLARRQAADPALADQLLEWLTKLEQDAVQMEQVRGVHKLHNALAGAIGERPATVAAERIGRDLTARRDSGQLRMAAETGTLGITGAVAVPRHTFHGGPQR